MLSELVDPYTKASKWANDNQGVVSVIIFLFTLTFGWFSGIFSALRRRPKFKFALSDGPTFCCTYLIGKKHENFEVHRTGIALYLQISNIGSAPSSIENISVGYHWNLSPFSLQWLRYSIGWFWLKNQSTALADFQANIGENIKIYPFLTQRSFLSISDPSTHLEIGQSTSGVIYFEQSASWGGCFPAVHNGKVRIKVSVSDVFGNNHIAKFWIPSVSLEEARKFNPAFGKTLAELHGETLPFDKQ